MASDPSTSPARDLANTTTFDDESCQDDCTPEYTENLAAGNDPWEPYDELCDLCGSLNIESLVSDHGSGGKIYELDVLIDAASRCKTCERLFNLKRLREIDGAYCNNGIHVGFRTSPRVGGCCGILRVEAVNVLFSRCTFTVSKVVAQYTVFTNEGDIASSKHGIHRQLRAFRLLEHGYTIALEATREFKNHARLPLGNSAQFHFATASRNCHLTQELVQLVSSTSLHTSKMPGVQSVQGTAQRNPLG
jgi:hypothetical protein